MDWVKSIFAVGQGIADLVKKNKKHPCDLAAELKIEASYALKEWEETGKRPAWRAYKKAKIAGRKAEARCTAMKNAKAREGDGE